MDNQEHHRTSQMGKWMVYLAWILFLGLSTVFFNNYLEKQHNPNIVIQSQVGADNTIEVILQQSRYGHYVTNGEINDKPVIFLLDTGATNISIPNRTAKRLGLKRGVPMSVRTANGTITVYNTKLNTVAIGPIVLHGLRGDINPHMEGDEILLGMNFLKHLELIQRGKELMLRQIPKAQSS